MFKNNIIELIGNTPMLRLNGSNIYAKLEYFNPLHSVKDRAALYMIEGAEARGELAQRAEHAEPHHRHVRAQHPLHTRYLTYENEEAALRCIRAVDGFCYKGHLLKSSRILLLILEPASAPRSTATPSFTTPPA